MGVGSNTRPFQTKWVGGQEYYVSNKAFYQQFFSLPLESIVGWDDLEVYVPVKKAVNAYRVFIFGGSAANGMPPDPLCNFGRQLSLMLENVFPSKQIEMYNLASPGCNSHVMRALALELGPLKPDLFIVYMGNNEFVGPFGAGSNITSAYLKSITAIRARIFLSGLRLFQWMQGRTWRERSATVIDPQDLWRYLSPIFPEDSKVGTVYHHFQENLGDMIDAGCRFGAHVLICTVGVNLDEWPPFYSSTASDLPKELKRRWEEYYALGKEAEKAGDFNTALSHYKKALSIDEQHAELLFRLGRVLKARGDFEEAFLYFEKARDRDWVLTRATSKTNDVIRKTKSHRSSNSGNVILLDIAQEMYSAQLSGKISGNDFFYDNVHFRPEGHYFLATSLFQRLFPLLARSDNTVREGEIPVPPLSFDACMAAFAVTPTIRARHVDVLLRMFDIYGDMPLAGWENHLECLRRDAKSFQEQASQFTREHENLIFEECVEKRPHDAFVLKRYLEHLFVSGDYERFLERSKMGVSRFPYRRNMQRYHAQALYAMGKPEDAKKHLEFHVRNFPDDAPAYLLLGDIEMQTKNYMAARDAYQSSVQHDASNYEAQYGLAMAWKQAGYGGRSLQALMEAVYIEPRKPRSYAAIYELADMLPVSLLTGSLQSLAEQYPKLPMPRFWFGKVLLRDGKEIQARQEFAEALNTCPDSAEGKRLAASIHEMLGNISEAIVLLQTIIASGPQDFEVFDHLDTLLRQSTSTEEHLNAWRNITRENPDAGRAFFHLALAETAAGNTAEAEAAYRKALAFFPDDPAVYSGLGILLIGEGKSEFAMEYLQQALQLNPGIHHVRLALIEIMLRRAEPCDAVKELLSNAPVSFVLPEDIASAIHRACQ